MKSSNSNKATASDQPRWFAMAVILIMALQIITCEGRIVERSLKRDTYYYTKAAKTKAAKAVNQTKSAKNVPSMETNAHSMMNKYTKAGKDEIGVGSKSSKARVDFHHAHSMSMGGVSYETKAAKTKAAKGDSHFSFFHHGSTDGADVELNATAVNATNTTDEAATATSDAVVSDRAPLTAGREEEGFSSSGGHVLSRRNFISFLASSASALFFLIRM